MYTQIEQARATQTQIATLQQELSKLFTPTLHDTEMLPELYEQITNGQNAKEVRHIFVLLAVYLYSPSAMVGHNSIKAGLCQKIGQTIGCCRQVVSETFYEARFRYNNLNGFREQTDKLLAQVKPMLQK